MNRSGTSLLGVVLGFRPARLGRHCFAVARQGMRNGPCPEGARTRATAEPSGWALGVRWVGLSWREGLGWLEAEAIAALSFPAFAIRKCSTANVATSCRTLTPSSPAA